MPRNLERFSLKEAQKKTIAALGRCSYLPGSFEKRFVRDINSQIELGLTRKQYDYARDLAYKYRRQLFGTAIAQMPSQCRMIVDALFPPLPESSQGILAIAEEIASLENQVSPQEN